MLPHTHSSMQWERKGQIKWSNYPSLSHTHTHMLCTRSQSAAGWRRATIWFSLIHLSDDGRGLTSVLLTLPAFAFTLEIVGFFFSFLWWSSFGPFGIFSVVFFSLHHPLITVLDFGFLAYLALSRMCEGSGNIDRGPLIGHFGVGY